MSILRRAKNKMTRVKLKEKEGKKEDAPVVEGEPGNSLDKQMIKIERENYWYEKVIEL